jgi:hypothetical protein
MSSKELEVTARRHVATDYGGTSHGDFSQTKVWRAITDRGAPALKMPALSDHS